MPRGSFRAEQFNLARPLRQFLGKFGGWLFGEGFPAALNGRSLSEHAFVFH